MKACSRFFIHLLVLTCFCVSSGASATELVIAFPEGNYAPHYDNTSGTMQGFLPALVRQFSADTGHSFSLQAMPIKRYQAFIQSGEVDFILPSNPEWSDNAKGNLLYSSVIMISRSGFVRPVTLRGSPIRDIATVTGYVLPEINPAFLAGKPDIYRTIDTHASLNMLKARRVDASYAHLDFVWEWVRKNNVDMKLYFEADAGFDHFSYHLATRKHGEIIQTFNRWLTQETATVLQLMEEYGLGKGMRIN